MWLVMNWVYYIGKLFLFVLLMVGFVKVLEYYNVFFVNWYIIFF